MNVFVFQILTVLAAAGSPATAENTLLKELVEKGVEMPDGQVVSLPAPTMPEGLSEVQQTAVLTKSASLGKATLQQFLDSASSAPVTLKVGKIPSKKGDDVIRTINAGFVVHGDWNVLTSEQFSKGIVKAGQANNQNNGGMVSKAGYLTANELFFRKLTTRSTTDLKEYFLYTTFNLFNRVELSATRFCVATKTPAGVVVAAKVDPRFGMDKENSIRTNGARSSKTLRRGSTGSIEVLFGGGLLCQGDPLDQAARRYLRRVSRGLLRTAGMVRGGREPNARRVAEDHSL